MIGQSVEVSANNIQSLQEVSDKKNHVPVALAPCINKNQSQKKGVDINFDNLKYSVQIKLKNQLTLKNEIKEKVILNNVKGICKQGEITAIMGSSGAGKTSLLNVLCKRIQKTKKNNLEGIVKANDTIYNYENFSDFASYIMQDDRLLETLTVKEALQFAARLKIKGTKEQQEAKVDYLIRHLKLQNCQNTVIGGNMIKGISGGERKRTSIAVELVTDPDVILLDEPTSGLDSFTAYIVISQLKQLAQQQNKTIIFTIHQPSSDIWNLFDRVMLLVKGNFIYQGQGGHSVIDYFNQKGFACPITSNPSDYLMSIMHKESEVNRKNYQIYFNNYDETLAPTVNEDYDNRQKTQIVPNQGTSDFMSQVKEIYKRTQKQTIRNPMLFKARIGQTIFLSIFISMIYWQLEDGKDDPTNQTDMSNFTGFFFLHITSTFMSSMMPMIMTFPEERPVFLKEENSKLYSVSSYFIGRTLLEFPYLLFFPMIQTLILFFTIGLRSEVDVFFKFYISNVLVSVVGNSIGLMCASAFSNAKTAVEMVPMFIMPFLLFGGFFSNRDSLWDGVAWIEYISPFKYALDSHINNQFEETYFKPSPIDQLNQDFGFWKDVIVLACMFVGYRLIAFILLSILKKRLQ